MMNPKLQEWPNWSGQLIQLRSTGVLNQRYIFGEKFGQHGNNATAARATFRSRLLNRLPTLKAILQGWFIIGSANQPLKKHLKKRQKKIRGGGSPNKHRQATSCFRRHKETSRGEKNCLKLQGPQGDNRFRNSWPFSLSEMRTSSKVNLLHFSVAYLHTAWFSVSVWKVNISAALVR